MTVWIHLNLLGEKIFQKALAMGGKMASLSARCGGDGGESELEKKLKKQLAAEREESSFTGRKESGGELTARG